MFLKFVLCPFPGSSELPIPAGYPLEADPFSVDVISVAAYNARERGGQHESFQVMDKGQPLLFALGQSFFFLGLPQTIKFGTKSITPTARRSRGERNAVKI